MNPVYEILATTSIDSNARAMWFALSIPLSWLSDLFRWLFVLVYVICALVVLFFVAAFVFIMLWGTFCVLAIPFVYLYERLTEKPPTRPAPDPYRQIDTLSNNYEDAAQRLLFRR